MAYYFELKRQAGKKLASADAPAGAVAGVMP
jgi:hypothetical protein